MGSLELVRSVSRYSPANTSRHLTLLTRRGPVAREACGNRAIYSIADESVYACASWFAAASRGFC